jgi:hypothetical protein
VFAVGVGAIEGLTTAAAYGESKSYEPVLATGSKDFTMKPAQATSCKTWWTDPDSGERSPVFAGLPFMPFYGAYAIHGPIDGFRAPNGGSLRRGFVSHGCVRMEAADVLEVYGRLRGLEKVPVHVQREPERDSQGRRVDIAQRWIGAECAADGDCNFDGGFCKHNRYSERGFCSARCTSICADRANLPTTFCVADPDDATQGMCVSKMTSQDLDCRAGDHLVPVAQPRFGQPSVSATVCVPGSPGWIGDHCFADGDCKHGTSCAGASGSQPGQCTESCLASCPDQPGAPTTICIHDRSDAASCFRECTPASNAAECAAGFDCVRSQGGDTRSGFHCHPHA